jgi:hypothetical protein
LCGTFFDHPSSVFHHVFVSHGRSLTINGFKRIVGCFFEIIQSHPSID